MNPPPRNEAFVVQYEELRRDALRRGGDQKTGVGLTLFLRQGMRAWMRGCADYVPRAESQRPPTPSAPLPLEVRTQLTVILAGLIASARSRSNLP